MSEQTNKTTIGYCNYCEKTTEFSNDNKCLECNVAHGTSKADASWEEVYKYKKEKLKLKASKFGYCDFVVTPDNIEGFIECQLQGLSDEDKRHILITIQGVVNYYAMLMARSTD